MDFDISEIVTKNILMYRIFDKESWDCEARDCDYQYTN